MLSETNIHPDDVRSVVRTNLMTRQGYQPYCGNMTCPTMPRTYFNKQRKQFVCPCCGWTSEYPYDFIQRYTQKWNIEV